jgi:hypothetical protein
MYFRKSEPKNISPEKTYFWLPFNSPKKSAESAFSGLTVFKALPLIPCF